MNQNLIAYYINQLTLSDATRLAKQYHIDLTQNEIKTILDFLKKNRFRVNRENKNTLLKEAQPLFSKETYNKIVLLVDKFIK